MTTEINQIAESLERLFDVRPEMSPEDDKRAGRTIRYLSNRKQDIEKNRKITRHWK